MKTCPQCNTQYSDDTLQFCLQDGTQLPDNPGAEYETQEIDERETVISRKSTNKINFDLSQPEEKTWERPRPDSNSFATADEPGSSRTLIAVLLTVFVMLLLFGMVGAGAWFYLGQQTGGQTTQTVNTANTENSNTAKSNSNTNGTNSSPKKTPEVDKEAIVKNVSARLSSWKAQAEARNLKNYMGNYASRVDYYSKRRASRSFVEADKKRAFTDYTSIKSKFTNIKITPSADGKTATAIFDKEWDFSGPAKKTTGKVRSRLIFRLYGTRWLIVSERDIKVYYVNKS